MKTVGLTELQRADVTRKCAISEIVGESRRAICAVVKNFTSSAPVGTPPFQLPAVDQLVSVTLAAVQYIVAAFAVVASDMAASNVRSLDAVCFM